MTDLASLSRLEAVPGSSSPANTSCAPNGEPALLVFDSRPAGGSAFRYAGQFMFDWDTSLANRSRCYRLRVLLDDGSPARVTIIRFE